MASSSNGENPWQVLLAGAALIILGVTYAVWALVMVSEAGDRLGLDAHLKDYAAVTGFEAQSVALVHDWLTMAAIVFAIVATVVIMLGAGLWRGVAREGLRITATITTLIALIGSWIPYSLGRGSVDAVPEESLFVILVVHLVVFLVCLLLWMPSLKPWMKESSTN